MKLIRKLRPNVVITWTLISILLAIILGIYLVNALSQKTPILDEKNQLKTFSSLTYCSDPDDDQCQSGVAKFDFRVLSRDIHFQVNRDFPKDDKARLILEEITLKFNARTQDLFGQDFFIYADSNNNGTFELDKDQSIARSLIQKKRMLFEDLDEMHSFRVPLEGLNVVETYFIYNPETEATIPEGSLEKIRVKSLNSARANEEIINESAFADRSTFKYSDQISVSKKRFLDENPEFVANGSGVRLKAKEQTFNRTVIIPEDLPLTINPGTNINIAGGKSLVSYSPVQFKGTKSAPITIKSVDDQPYGTFAIIGSIDNDQTVNVLNTIFENGSQAEINGAFLSGMFSVYRIGNTNVSGSTFRGSKSDDGLNIKYSKVDLHDNIFDRNSADAFDGDFVSGVVRHNLFVENGNDGLDFSGSDIQVRYNHVISSGDKCASVGENTKATITLNYFDGCYIGVEVKDKSDASIFRNVIINSRETALNSYIKKLFFGEPTTTYSQNILINGANQISGLIDQSQLSKNITSGSIEQLKRELPWLDRVITQIPQP